MSIGYRVLPSHIAQLSDSNKLDLLHFLGKTCGLPVQDVVCIDMLMDVTQVYMEAHVRDRQFSGVLGQHVVDVKTFKPLRYEQVPEFLLKQFVSAAEVPPEGFGNAPLSPITPTHRSF